MLPRQIKNIHASIDVFYKANSFVEMLKDIAENCAKILNKDLVPLRSFISLIKYDLSSTFKPDDILSYFVSKSRKFSVERLSEIDKKIFIS